MKVYLLTLSKPIKLRVEREEVANQDNNERYFNVSAEAIAVEVTNEIAIDEIGMMDLTVTGYIPHKSERSTCYWLREGLGGPQKLKLRESLVQAIQDLN